MRKATRLLFAELAIVLIFAGAIAYSLLLPSRSYHFREVSLNFYPNGAVDFSADMTGLVRALGLVALMTMVFGLLVGTAIGLGALDLSRTAHAIGNATVKDSMEVLLKSGFVRGPAGEGKTEQYEITDTGLRFLKEYQELNDGPEQAPATTIRTRENDTSR